MPEVKAKKKKRITPPLKFFGGKSYLAPLIHKLAPPKAKYTSRLIPYCGAIQEMWNWEYDDVSEVVNDVDCRLTNLWHCLRIPALFEQLKRELEATPFSRPVFDYAKDMAKLWDKSGADWFDKLDKTPSPYWAAQFFVLVRQSLGGMCESFAPLSTNRTRGRMNEQVSAWLTSIEGLDAVHARMKRVVVERMDALKFMTKYDGPNVLFYLDPPYIPETRSAKKVYRHEMTYDEHVTMLAALPALEGRVMVSGYTHPEYEARLTARGWRRHRFDVTLNSGSAKTKARRIECIWMNYDRDGSMLQLQD